MDGNREPEVVRSAGSSFERGAGFRGAAGADAARWLPIERSSTSEGDGGTGSRSLSASDGLPGRPSHPDDDGPTRRPSLPDGDAGTGGFTGFEGVCAEDYADAGARLIEPVKLFV
jgi:hypothetical protein